MSGRPEERHNSTSHRSHRNRSRSPKSKKDKSSGHHQTHRDDKRKTDSKQRAQKKENTQLGIEQAKSRLKSSLSSAINDTRESGSSDAYPRRMANDFPTDFVESVTRQAEIDRIEGPGFNPAAFKSNVELKRASLSAGGAKNLEKGGGNTLTASGISSDHDRAMFGPLWASKEIEKKQALMTQQQKQQSQTTASTDDQQQQIRPAHRFPLAHERLSEDPEVRNQRWLELFKQRRKMALEGTLTQ